MHHFGAPAIIFHSMKGCAKSKYRGVSRPTYRGKDAGWIAQNRTARLWKSGFPSDDIAAKWLSSKLKVPLRSLLHDQVEEPFKRTGFLGVTPHWRSGDRVGPPRWQARLGATKLGEFATEEEAAACVAKAKAVPKRKLARRIGLTRKFGRDLFRATYSVFKEYVPQDLHVLRLHEIKYRADFKKAVFRLLTLLPRPDLFEAYFHPPIS